MFRWKNKKKRIFGSTHKEKLDFRKTLSRKHNSVIQCTQIVEHIGITDLFVLKGAVCSSIQVFKMKSRNLRTRKEFVYQDRPRKTVIPLHFLLTKFIVSTKQG